MNPVAKKRILRDMREIDQNPLPGLSAAFPDDSCISKVCANVQLLEGKYQGVIIPLLLTIPDDYPFTPPSAHIQKGHPFNNTFHQNIMSSDQSGMTPICTDMTKEYHIWHAGEAMQKGTGWNPSYTIQGLLIQLQIFFTNPYNFPQDKVIEEMKKKVMNYKLTIKGKDDGKDVEYQYTYENPYPQIQKRWEPKSEEKSMDVKPETKTEETEPIPEKVSDSSQEEFKANEEPKPETTDNSLIDVDNKLYCPVLKKNFRQDPKMKMGFPMLIVVDRFNRLQITPVIELLSEEAVEEIRDINRIGKDKFKSLLGEEFNEWVPIYINEEHFKSIYPKLERLKEKYFGARKDGVGIPLDYLRLLPPILVKSAVHFLKGIIHHSMAALDAYCQYHFLFRKLIEKHPVIQEEIDRQVDFFLADDRNKHKREAGDLGELLIKISLSKYGLFNEKVSFEVFKENLARKVSWTMKEDSVLASKGKKADNLVKRFLTGAPTSIEFYLLQYEIAKLLINDETYAYQSKNYGCVHEDTLKAFRAKMLEIQKIGKTDWKYIVETQGFQKVITNVEDFEKLVEEAIDRAQKVYRDDINMALNLKGGRRS